jgi:hypothetical protein
MQQKNRIGKKHTFVAHAYMLVFFLVSSIGPLKSIKRADKSDAVKETRKQVYKEAQDRRVKEGDAEAEAEAIRKYWADYQDKSDTYYTNDMWKEYKKQHNEPLKELFANFLTLVVNNRNKKWSDISGLGRFISAENAVKYLGDNPIAGLKNMFVVDKKHEDVLEGESDVVLLKLKQREQYDFELFEKNVLFNLYKEQQKHEFDYFFYESGNENK